MTAEDDEEIGRCWECGYSLRGLPTPRCPECGRGFDPADETTMNMGVEVGTAKKWIMRPPGWPFHVLTLGAVLLSLWACVMPTPTDVFVDPIVDIFVTRYGIHRLPWGTMLRLESPMQRFLTGFCLWSLIAVIWITRRIGRGITVKRLSKHKAAPFAYWRRWLITPVIFGVTVLICRTSLPTYAGFWLSKPWLDRAVAQGEVNSANPLTIGLFDFNSDRTARGFHVFIYPPKTETDSAYLHLGRSDYFVFRKDGKPDPTWRRGIYRQLSQKWFWLQPNASTR